jgi:hypothetical protein
MKVCEMFYIYIVWLVIKYVYLVIILVYISIGCSDISMKNVH